MESARGKTPQLANVTLRTHVTLRGWDVITLHGSEGPSVEEVGVAHAPRAPLERSFVRREDPDELGGDVSSTPVTIRHANPAGPEIPWGVGTQPVDR